MKAFQSSPSPKAKSGSGSSFLAIRSRGDFFFSSSPPPPPPPPEFELRLRLPCSSSSSSPMFPAGISFISNGGGRTTLSCWLRVWFTSRKKYIRLSWTSFAFLHCSSQLWVKRSTLKRSFEARSSSNVPQGSAASTCCPGAELGGWRVPLHSMTSYQRKRHGCLGTELLGALSPRRTLGLVQLIWMTLIRRLRA